MWTKWILAVAPSGCRLHGRHLRRFSARRQRRGGRFEAARSCLTQQSRSRTWTRRQARDPLPMRAHISVPAAPARRYAIAARKQGFKPGDPRRRCQLELNQVAKIDFTMEAGAISETVEVQGAAPLLESNTSSVGHGDRDQSGQRSAAQRPQLRAACHPRPGRHRRRLFGLRDDRQRAPVPTTCGPAQSCSRTATVSSRTTSCSTASITTPPERSDHPATVGGSGARIQDPDQSVPGEAGAQTRRDHQRDHQIRLEHVHGSAYEFFPQYPARREEFFTKPGSPKLQYQQNQLARASAANSAMMLCAGERIACGIHSRSGGRAYVTPLKTGARGDRSPLRTATVGTVLTEATSLSGCG